MTLPHRFRAYETWAPVLARVLFGVMFLVAAWGHLPGSESYVMQTGIAGAAGIPFPEVAVILAFILELAGGLALIAGYMTRLFAFLLMLYVVLLTLIFHTSFADPMAFGMFINHLAVIAGLIYVSVYGAQSAAVATCPLPQGLSRG